MMIGLSLVPTIVGSVAPTIVVNSAALEATIVQFIPTGLALALLVIAFGVAVGITIQSHSAESKPIAIVIAVIVLVIGVGLITSISDARDSALAATKGQSNGATCNASATYTGSATATTARANADAAIASTSCDFGGHKEPTSVASPATSGTATVNRDADATLLISRFTLADTVLNYVVVGYVLSLLTAAFGLANMGTGGRITRFAQNRMNR